MEQEGVTVSLSERPNSDYLLPTTWLSPCMVDFGVCEPVMSGPWAKELSCLFCGVGEEDINTDWYLDQLPEEELHHADYLRGFW